MRDKFPYISIEYTGGTSYVVHAFLNVPSHLSVVTNTLAYNKIKTKNRLGGVPSIECSQFLMKLKTGGGGPSGLQHFKSVEFKRDTGIDHIWVAIDEDDTIQPNDGAVGNYDDPD